MINYEQAIKAILENVDVLSTEKIFIEDSVNRVAAEDIYSRIEMPPFDKSAMDGYAVAARDTQSAPVKLERVGIIQAGESFRGKLKRGECLKIMTGSPLPENSDSVVMVEDTRQAAGFVEALKTVRQGENVCFKGEDLKSGMKIIKRGTKISSSHVALLAAAGRQFISAVRKPYVAIINTGGEIVSVGNKLGRNKIYNSNGPMLEALLKSDGVESSSLGIVKDSARDLKKAIKRGLRSDVVLISGGVSMGDYDLVPGVLSGLGVRKVFHKVKIKPGKPIFFGRKAKKVVFGIPGNPVSNFLTYLIFIRPALYKMMGYKYYKPAFKEGIVENEFYSKPGRRHFVLAKISKRGSRYYLNPTASHGSADILALSQADGFMVIKENCGVIKNNSKVSFITWKIE